MTAGITLVIVVAAAYLAARVAFDWLARRFLIVSGAEYVVLGILLGPQGFGLVDNDALRSFAPITLLALGWIGAIIGTGFYLPALVAVRGIVYRLAFVESILTLLTIFGLMMAALYLVGIPQELAWIPALGLAAIGTASTSTAADVVSREIGPGRPLVGQLRVSTRVNALVAVLVLGVILSIHHGDPGVLSRPITPTEWMVITIGVGVLGGSMFYLFLGNEEQQDRLIIALGGAVVLVSGAAEYLGLSPLVAGLFFGAILTNTADNRDEITRVLESVERPLYFLLLVVAGATWVPSREPWAFAVVALFLYSLYPILRNTWTGVRDASPDAVAAVALFRSARAVGNLGGARLAARANGVLDRLGKDWGLGLLGQGGLALALCINYTFQEAAILQDVVFTGAIASVLLTDFLSARLMHAAVLAAEESAPGPLAESELTGGFDAERDERHPATPIPGGIH